MALRTPTKDAEEIKQKFGCALRELADPNATVQVPGVGERASRQLSRQTLAEVIEPRVEELYSLIQAELRRSGFEELLSSGIVLTGGSSLMQGMVELGEEIFHMPVRVGTPNYAGSLAEVVRSPRYSTAVGLLLSGSRAASAAADRAHARCVVQAGVRSHADVVPGQFLSGRPRAIAGIGGAKPSFRFRLKRRFKLNQA